MHLKGIFIPMYVQDEYVRCIYFTESMSVRAKGELVLSESILPVRHQFEMEYSYSLTDYPKHFWSFYVLYCIHTCSTTALS